MRLFQNSGVYPSYLASLNQLAVNASSFEERRRIFLEDRYGALHILKPVLEGDPEAFYTNGDDEVLQRLWAREQGIPENSTPETILLAQIEHHRTEILYNTDPVRFPSAFVRKLPGSVRKTVCWRAVPENADLTAYHAVLGNFPSIREFWRKKGCRVEVFYPAHDPVMDEYDRGERPIDVLFVGGYSRHHKARARTLEQVAKLAADRRIVYCLDASRLTKLAEGTIGAWLPLKKHRRPDSIARIAKPPVFGRQLYELIGSSKIVLNGAIDIAGVDRGNMRCFEAMGCGALLVSDAGNYPAGMEPGRTIEAYDSPERAATLVPEILRNWPEFAAEAARGKAEVTGIYSKALQWKRFVDIVAAV
jgi:Glycosyl transferases group 1